MLLTLIVSCILIGIILIVLEVLVVPGTTVVGGAGLVLIIGGVMWMYADFGTVAGHWSLVISAAATILAVVYAMRSGAWNRFSLKSAIDSRASNDFSLDVHVADEGISLSALRPMGTVELNDKRYEARTAGEMLPQNTKVIVVSISGNTIIVKSKID